MAAVGTVSIKVVPELEGFTESMQTALFALAAHGLLTDFTSWLDSHGLMSEGEHSAEDLVQSYIDSQAPNA